MAQVEEETLSTTVEEHKSREVRRGLRKEGVSFIEIPGGPRGLEGGE